MYVPHHQIGFSAYTNTTKLIKMTTSTPDQLPCLNGLKCLSMVWIVAGHQFSVPMKGSITNSKYMLEWIENLYSMFLCVGQTWYLNIDFQLYLISPAVFYALWKYPKLCIAVLVVCVLGFIAGSFYVAWANDLTAILTNLYGSLLVDLFNNNNNNNNSYNYQNNYYLLFGSCGGVCFGTLLACVLGGHSTLRGEEYDRWGNAFHIALEYQFWGTLWYSAGLSYLLILMTESPVIIIEKMLFGSFSKKKQPKRDVQSGVDNAAFEKYYHS
ncbi:hypothetical protein GEV33_014961 [Tenebrio molitor]|uniref:Acyltransferase 3 domain-containing protein n=1 Tax=Tenebrio molitor TaxID=7067 RepID=A0A8J6L4C4_TENMO|nr:hypothetical protein GEV33_014961 [Tenebrio molitor]